MSAMTATKALRLIASAAGIVGTETTPTDGWNSVIGSLPSGPNVNDNMVGFRRTGSMVEDGKIQNPGLYIKFPYVQVMVRGQTHEVAEKKCEQLAAYFASVRRVSLVSGDETALVHSIKLVTDCTFVKQEDRNRGQLYSMNFQITITEN